MRRSNCLLLILVLVLTSLPSSIVAAAQPDTPSQPPAILIVHGEDNHINLIDAPDEDVTVRIYEFEGNTYIEFSPDPNPIIIPTQDMSLIINGSHTDSTTFIVGPLGADYLAELTINGVSGTDSVVITNTLDFADNKSLFVNSQHIEVAANASVTTSNGHVTFSADSSIQMQGGSGITSDSGGIELQANAAMTSTANTPGIVMDGASISTNDGSVLLNGTAGSGLAPNMHGVDISNGSTITVLGLGSISITGKGASVSEGINIANGQLSAFIGDIVLNTDTLRCEASVIQSMGILTIAPISAGTSIGLGGGLGTLNLDNTEIGMLSDGFSKITIGSNLAGDITVGNATFVDSVELISIGKITDGGASDTNIDAGGNTVTLNGTVAPGASPGTFSITGNVVLADASSLEVEVMGATGSASYDVLDIEGSLSFDSNVALSILPLAYTHEAGELNIIQVTGPGSVSGTFVGLAEGALTNGGSAHDYNISYVGGDGNDVILAASVPAAVSTLDMVGGHNWMIAVFGTVFAMIPLAVKRRD